MEQRFKEVLNKLSGDNARPHTILAVSGGIDSVAMVYLYHECELPFSIAHCNFQLRDKESLMDEEFVMALGAKMEVKVLIKRFETEKYATEKSISIQMAARDLRYNWFKELALEFDVKIAIAHHANDVAETMLFNFTKGTGLAGLHGIAENDGIIIRPLLWATKDEIIEFAQKRSIEWREDHSNESEKYMRNIIRKKVIPELERVNPSFIATSLRNASRIKDAEAFIKHAIGELGLIEQRDGHNYIDKIALLKLPGCEAVLYQLIKSYNFSYEQVRLIIQSNERAGAIFIARDWVLNIDRDHFIISKNEQKLTESVVGPDDDFMMFEEFSLQASVLSAEGYQIIPEKHIAALDYDKLTFPMRLRNWQQGDHFMPLGMEGRKKVSDFLIDEKVPVNLKRNLLVMLSGDEIVWLVGWRIDNRYKVTPATKTVYQIEQLIA